MAQVKALVLRRFRNKYSKKIHEPGDILKVSPSRLKEIQEALPGYVDPLEEKSQALGDVETQEEPEVAPTGQAEAQEEEPDKAGD